MIVVNGCHMEYKGSIAYPFWSMARRPKSPPCSRPASPIKFSDTHYRDEDPRASVRQQYCHQQVQVQLRRRGQCALELSCKTCCRGGRSFGGTLLVRGRHSHRLNRSNSWASGGCAGGSYGGGTCGGYHTRCN